MSGKQRKRARANAQTFVEQWSARCAEMLHLEIARRHGGPVEVCVDCPFTEPGGAATVEILKRLARDEDINCALDQTKSCLAWYILQEPPAFELKRVFPYEVLEALAKLPDA